jgi:endonuclease/exonuclease/phosphatase family metal-dependent hydrolase
MRPGRVAALVVGLVLVVVAGVVAAITLVPQPQSASPAPPAPSSSAPTPEPPDPQSTATGGTLAPCPRSVAPRLRALTLNIHFGKTPAGEPGLAQIARELRAWDPDVVVLNEVDRGRGRSGGVAQARELGRLTGLTPAYGPNRRYGGGTSGNAVLSRLPVLGSRNQALPFRAGTIPRGLLRVTVELAGRPVDVYATHFENTSAAARRAQAREVGRTVSRGRRPFVLGGDLNAGPEGVALQVLDGFGLVDSWSVVGRGDGLTVPAAAPRKRIDYLLSDDSMVPVRSEVLLSRVSDHRGVRTVFELASDC